MVLSTFMEGQKIKLTQNNNNIVNVWLLSFINVLGHKLIASQKCYYESEYANY